MPDALLARIQRIDDPDDPRVADFRDIKERDLRGRQGLCIVEGTVVLRVLASEHRKLTLGDLSGAGVTAERILILENRLEGLRDILVQFPDTVPIMVASRPVIDAIAGFAIHRGVLATARPAVERTVDATVAALPPSSLVLVASGISNHDNMGSLFRNAAAFRVDGVFLDAACCDPLYRKAIRVSVGAALKVLFARQGTVGDIIARLSGDGFDVWGLSPSGRVGIDALMPGRRAALVVGTEGEGLAPALLCRMETARIPQAGDFDSLNVATAAGIALHRLAARMGRLA